MAPRSQYKANNIQALILHITWLCLNVSDYVNPRFPAVFPSFDQLAAIFPKLGLTFVDGLFDVVQSANPPSIKWFLSLSTFHPIRAWGICVLVLRKGGRFKIYIGSGTSTVNNGVRYRILQHKGSRVEPGNVRTAKRQCYKLVHCSLLAWCNVPTATDVPVFRTAIVAIEAAFSFIFWPMYSRTTKYGFPDGPWTRTDFAWEGLCSHNPLIEGNDRGNERLDLSPASLRQINDAATQRRQSVRNAWDRKARAKKSPKYLEARRARARKYQPIASAKAKLQVEKKRYHCAPCN